MYWIIWSTSQTTIKKQTAFYKAAMVLVWTYTIFNYRKTQVFSVSKSSKVLKYNSENHC